MDEKIRARCLAIGQYLVAHRATVRAAAKVFGLSKSTIHKDMRLHLPDIDPSLGLQVAELLQYNKAVRHLRGGEATRRRFLCKKPLQSSQNAVY